MPRPLTCGLVICHSLGGKLSCVSRDPTKLVPVHGLNRARHLAGIDRMDTVCSRDMEGALCLNQ